MAICFVTVVILTISLGFGIYNIVELYNPELTMNSWEWEKYQTNDAFFHQMPNQYVDNGEMPLRENIDEITLTKLRVDGLNIAIKSERRQALQDFIRIIIILFINIVVFIPHWMLAKKSREIQN